MSVSPTELPSLGDAYQTREELSTLIKTNGKAMGYIFKCSVTSQHRCTWYCSNKYSAPRCLAGFKAAFEPGAGWLVTEAQEHNENCTRARQRVNIVKTGGTPAIAVKPASPGVATATDATAKKLPAADASKSSTGGTKSRPKSLSTTRAPSSTFTSTASSVVRASRPPPATRNTSPPTASKNGSGGKDSSDAASTSGSLSPTSDTSRPSAANLSGSSGRQQRHCKRPPSTASAKLTAASANARGGGNTSNNSTGRDRSTSFASASSRGSGSRSTSERSYVTTILDPAFHFPPAALEAAPGAHKSIPSRRKRSTSYVKASQQPQAALLLGQYIESQQQQLAQVEQPVTQPAALF